VDDPLQGYGGNMRGPVEKWAGTGALASAALAVVLLILGAAPAAWAALGVAIVTAVWCLYRALRRASAVLEDADREITERRARRARSKAGRHAALADSRTRRPGQPETPIGSAAPAFACGAVRSQRRPSASATAWAHTRDAP
jgi:hypothetical protein